MKKTLAFISIALATCLQAQYLPLDLVFLQINDAVDGAENVLVNAPAVTLPGDADGMIFYDAAETDWRFRYYGVTLSSAFSVNKTTRTMSVDYAGLLNKPTLGTASAQAIAAFATAAQGTKADSAIQAASIGTTVQGYIANGSTAQYLRGDGSKATFPTAVSSFSNDSGYLMAITNGMVLSALGFTPGVGTVTSVAAGTGLSGGTITGTGTISMPDTGTSGTYSGVTTDAQGRVIAGTTRSFSAPSRALVGATNATGYQISATRDSHVSYEGSFQTTATIGGPASITVFLETADTNSTTPGDWTVVARQVNSNTITLAIVLQQVDSEPWSIVRIIPAGKYVRIRYGAVSGTAAATINAEQQEVQL